MSDTSRILAHLNNTGLAIKDNQLYQVLNELITEVGLIVVPTSPTSSKFYQLTPVLFAQVPALAKEGLLASITDSTTVVPGATITGGGTDHVLGYFDGTNWIVA